MQRGRQRAHRSDEIVGNHAAQWRVRRFGVVRQDRADTNESLRCVDEFNAFR
jgi:hypothetical protein